MTDTQGPFIYRSCVYGEVCFSYHKYINGYMRFGYNGLSMYSPNCRQPFEINGVDVIEV